MILAVVSPARPSAQPRMLRPSGRPRHVHQRTWRRPASPGGFPSSCERPGPRDRVRGDTGADVMIVGLFIPRCLVGDRFRYFDSQHLNDAIDDVTRLMQGLMSYGGIHVMLYDRQCILRFVQFG